MYATTCALPVCSFGRPCARKSTSRGSNGSRSRREMSSHCSRVNAVDCGVVGWISLMVSLPSLLYFVASFVFNRRENGGVDFSALTMLFLGAATKPVICERQKRTFVPV